MLKIKWQIKGNVQTHFFYRKKGKSLFSPEKVSSTLPMQNPYSKLFLGIEILFVPISIFFLLYSLQHIQGSILTASENAFSVGSFTTSLGNLA